MASVIRGSGTSSLGGDLDIEGVLTYEDVASVDSVGIITARSGLHVGTGTSISSPSSNVLTLGTNNEERFRITSAGEIGIGTASPRDPVHIFHPTNNVNLLIESGDANSYLAFKDDTTTSDTAVYLGAEGNNLKFITSAAERLRITSDGDLGLGVSDGMDQAGTLYIVGGQAVRWTHPTDGTLYGDHYVSAAGAHVLRGGSSLTERLRITSDGEVIKALQPRFHADMLDGGVETNQTAYDGRDVSSHRIEYSNTQYDIGGNFTTSGSNKGLFTVPVEGLYLFHASASIQSGANWAQSWFIVNGSRVRGTDWVLATSSTVAMNSIQLYLSAGATVGFHPYNNASGNTISGTRYHTYFKGCLLG
jgi:hypothetical protein